MGRIREIVDAAFASAVLTVDAEAELQRLTAELTHLDDLIALVLLQQATLSGRVDRETNQNSPLLSDSKGLSQE